MDRFIRRENDKREAESKQINTNNHQNINTMSNQVAQIAHTNTPVSQIQKSFNKLPINQAQQKKSVAPVQNQPQNNKKPQNNLKKTSEKKSDDGLDELTEDDLLVF